MLAFGAASFVACENTPNSTSTASNVIATELETNSSVSTSETGSSSQTQPVQTEATDWFTWPEALFYNPDYTRLTEDELMLLNAFVSYKTIGIGSDHSSTVITTGKYLFFDDASELVYTTWDNKSKQSFYFSREIYNEIKPILKRSADVVYVDGQKAYLYNFENPLNPYDEHEVFALQWALNKEITQGYYKSEFENFVDSYYSDYAK